MNARQMIARFADGGDVSTGLKYATDKGGIGADQYYANIRNFINTQGADLNAAEVRAEMNKYGVSDKDVRDALAGTQYSAGAVHALLNPDIGAKGSPGYGVGGLEGMSANIRAQVEEATRQAQQGMLPQGQAAEFFTKHLSPTGGFNEADLIRATGKTSAELLAQMRPTILPPTEPLPDLPGKFVAPTAPPPEAPPVALTEGQEGLDPSTAIVGAIPQSERVTNPQLDTEFRAAAPRTAIYDRFGRISGYTYTPSTKLTPATGTNVFNFVPPGITSRPRSLLNLGDVPGVTVDPVTGQMRMPLSSSQRFARDRSELDNQFRRLYAGAAASDTSLPAQAPAGAAAAFRQFAMSDPTMSAQLRMRDIEQTPLQQQEYAVGGGDGPNTQAARQLRSQFGQAPYAAALTEAFDPFLARNRAALLATTEEQKGYFDRYPDLKAEYEKNWAKSMTPDEYALYHYRTLGQKEGRTAPNLMGSPYTRQFFSEGGEASTEDFVKKQSGGDVSRGTSSPNTAEVPQLDPEGRLIDEREEIRSESQRMLNRLKTAQQESYRRGKLPPGVQRAVTDVMSEDKPPLVRGKAIQTAGDIVGGFVSATPREPTNPSEVYKIAQLAGIGVPNLTVTPVGNVTRAARMAAQEPRATMSAAGRSARESLEALGDIPTALAQPNQLGAQAGIARAPGGFFPTSRVPGRSISDLDKGFEGVLKKIQDGPDDEKKQALMLLFNQKAKDFYTKQASSIDDPLRQDILSGRLRFEEGTPMADLFPKQLQIGAAKGDLQSLRMLEQNYDRMIGLKATIPYRQGSNPTPRIIETQIMQHIKDNLDQIPDAQLLAYAGRKPPPGPVGVAQAAAKVRQSLKDNPGLFETYLEPRIAKTLFPRYRELSDVYMVKYPALSPNVVNELRSPGSVKPDPVDATTDLKGYFLPEVEQAIEKNQPIYDVDPIFSPSLLGMRPDELLKEAKKLSQRELEKISFPQFVKKAFASSQEADERKKLLEQVPKLIKEGKAPPEKIMLSGTKTFLPTSEGFKWIKVTDPDAVVAIAKGMDNSVASYATSTTYGSLGKGRAALERGEAEIYSLYDKNNVPHMTVEYLTNKAVPPQDTPNAIVKNTIAQLTGNGPLTRNQDPSEQYIPHIKALVDKLNPSKVPLGISLLLRSNK